jgi:hypothetical protein
MRNAEWGMGSAECGAWTGGQAGKGGEWGVQGGEWAVGMEMGVRSRFLIAG